MRCSSPKTDFLLVRLHSLGDVVLAAPAAAAAAGGGTASFLTRTVYLPVVERFHPELVALGCDEGPFALRRAARNHGKQGVADLQANIATFLAFPRAKRFRFSRKTRRGITGMGASFGRMPLRSQAFLETAGFSGDPDPRIERRGPPVEGRFRVGLVAGGRWPMKAVPEGVLEELARLFCDLDRAEVFLLGEASDRAAADRILKRCAGRSVWNACGEGDMNALLNRLEGLHLLVSPDSGPAHLARALGVPTMVVFTSTSPELGFWKTDAPGTHMVEGVPCRPCHRHGGTACPLDAEACRKRLVPAEVRLKSMELL